MLGVIVKKNAGLIVPQDYIERAIANFPSSLGMAAVTEGKFELFSANAADTQFGVPDVMEMQETFKDEVVLMHFGHKLEGMTDHDLQPYEIVKEGGNAQLIAFLEGDFSNFYEEKSAHSDAFFAHAKFLLPFINKLMKQNDDDLDKVMAELDDDYVTKQNIANAILTKGAIVFMDVKERILAFDKTGVSHDYDWGWTSNHLDYGMKEYPEEKPEEKPAEAPRKTFGLRKPAAEAPKEEPKKQEPEKKPVLGLKKPAEKAPVIANTKPIEQPKTDTAVQVRKVKAPDKLTSNKSIKNFYIHNAGYVPDNFRQRPEVEVRIGTNGRPAKSFQELAQTIKQEPAQPETPVEAEPAKEQPVEAKPEETAPTPKEEPKPVAATMTPDDRKAIEAQFLTRDTIVKTLDKNSQEVIDPTKASELQSKLPSFEEYMGKPGLFESSKRWMVEDLHALGQASPAGLVRLLMDWRHKAMKLEETVAQMSEKKEEPAPRKTFGLKKTG